MRLTAFKSFRDAVLPLDDLTLVVGRNGSGKSNALDGLWALSRLAYGNDIREALDGGREGPAVRGGTAACAPFGRSAFTLGCRVRTGGDVAELDVTVQTEPDVQVVQERLSQGGEQILVSEPPRPGSADLAARWAYGDTRWAEPVSFRASRLLVTQVLSRVPANQAGRRIHRVAAQLGVALRSVFVLDPVPDRMRQYVPRRDVLLRRNAGNLSAAVASLLDDPGSRDSLLKALSRLNEQQVIDLTVSRSELDDLMVTLIERFLGQDHQVSARVMSDGSLRFLAILVALMQAPTTEASEPLISESDAEGQTTLVIEELENGLHASQATVLVGLIRDEVKRRRVRALGTAHSPALLDALTGDEHRSVVVCQRDDDGMSTLTRLVDLPNYVDVVAGGGLGRAAVKDRLRSTGPSGDPVALLDRLFGRPS